MDAHTTQNMVYHLVRQIWPIPIPIAGKISAARDLQLFDHSCWMLLVGGFKYTTVFTNFLYPRQIYKTQSRPNIVLQWVALQARRETKGESEIIQFDIRRMHQIFPVSGIQQLLICFQSFPVCGSHTILMAKPWSPQVHGRSASDALRWQARSKFRDMSRDAGVLLQIFHGW